MAMAQDLIQKQSTLKKALSSKTLNEFTEIQNEAAQENFNDMMSGATKVSEICIKICTESFEPINYLLTNRFEGFQFHGGLRLVDLLFIHVERI